MYEIKRDNRLSHALVHFVIDRASLFTDHHCLAHQFVPSTKHFKTVYLL